MEAVKYTSRDNPKTPEPCIDNERLHWRKGVRNNNEMHQRVEWFSLCSRYSVMRKLSDYENGNEFIGMIFKRVKHFTYWEPVVRAKTLELCFGKIEAWHMKATGALFVSSNASQRVADAALFNLDSLPDGVRYVANPKDSPVPAEPEGQREGKRVGTSMPGQSRINLFGHPITAVIRWMGKQGWDFSDASKALANVGGSCAEATVRAQLRAGKLGQRGEPANITSDEAKKLTQAIDKE